MKKTPIPLPPLRLRVAFPTQSLNPTRCSPFISKQINLKDVVKHLPDLWVKEGCKMSEPK